MPAEAVLEECIMSSSQTLDKQPLFTNKKLIALLIPIYFEQLLGIVVGMVDGIMVSSVGEAAISAVSLVGNISAVMVNLFAALASGGCIVTSQLLGANKHTDARRSAGQVVTLSVIVSGAIMLVCLLLNRQLLELFFGHIDEDVMQASITYFAYNALSFPFLAVCSAGGAILRANGNSRVSFYVSLLRNAVNIAGNAICIYGLGMGVEGVAIPTALCRIVGAVTVMLVVMDKKQTLRPDWKDIFSVSPRLMGRMTRVGLPTALESSMFQLGRVFTLSMISGFGTYQIAANSTAGALTNFAVIATTTTRIASLTVIGQCVGAHDMEQIKVNFRKLMIISYISHAVFAILTVIFRFPLIHLYKKLEPETVELAAQLLCIHLIPAIFLYPLSFFTSGPLRAANDSAFPMWVSILSMAIFRLTLAQILCVNLGWGAVGVWWAMIVDWCCRSVCFTVRWYRGKWKKKCGLDTLEVTQ